MDSTNLSSRAQLVVDYIRVHGASFFDEIADGTSLLPTQAEEALAELVAVGVVNSDSFGGLRALLIPADRRRSASSARRRRRIALFGMDAAGRWALVRREPLVDSAEIDTHLTLSDAALRRLAPAQSRGRSSRKPPASPSSGRTRKPSSTSHARC